MELDPNPSAVFSFSDNLASNTSNIPSSVLFELNSSINDIISISGLSPYISGYDYIIKSFYKALYIDLTFNIPVYFLPDALLKQLFPLSYNSSLPNSYNECFLVHFTFHSSELSINESAVGSFISILPPSQTQQPLLNVNIINFVVIDEFTINNYFFYHFPLLYRLSQSISISTNFALFASTSYFYDFVSFYGNVRSPITLTYIQFYYDFHAVRYSDYPTLYKIASDMRTISGYSENYVFTIKVTDELLQFMQDFKIELERQWWLLFAYSFTVLLFSFYSIWLALESQRKDLVDIYRVSVLKGYSWYHILPNLFFSYLLALLVSMVFGFVVSIATSNCILFILSQLFLIPNCFPFSLNFGPETAISTTILFIGLFIFTSIYLSLLYRHVSTHSSILISDSSYSPKIKFSSGMQVVAFTVGIVSLGWLISTLFLRNFLINQIPESNQSITFITDIMSYIITSIAIFSFVILALPLFIVLTIKALNKFASFSSILFVSLRNTIVNFSYFKQRFMFILFVILLMFQSFLLPVHISQKARDTARFYLGGDIAIKANNETTIENLLQTLSSKLTPNSFGNYTIIRTEIDSNFYYILFLSNSAISTIYFSDSYSLRYTRSDMHTLKELGNALMIHYKSVTNFKTLHELNNKLAVYLLFNNISAFPKKYYVIKEYYIVNTFDLFPILIGNNTHTKFGNNLIVASEKVLGSLLAVQNCIMFSILEKGIIANIKNKKDLLQLKKELSALYPNVGVKTWQEEYVYRLPLFSVSIFSLYVFAFSFSVILFLVIGYSQVRKYMEMQRKGLMVLRYRGWTSTTISFVFLIENLILMLFSCLIGFFMGYFLFKYSLELEISDVSFLPIVIYGNWLELSIGLILVVLIIELIIRMFAIKHYSKKIHLQMVSL